MFIIEQLRKTVRAKRLYEYLPKEDILKKISIRCSYGKDMMGLPVSEEFIKSVRTDIPRINVEIGDKLPKLDMPFMICYDGDLDNTIAKNPDVDANTAVRGIITTNLIVWDYLDKYPECYKVVDLRKGAKDDRGYRGVNLYYQLDGYHYPIEFKLYTKHDYECNTWIKSFRHKDKSDEWCRGLREAWDAGTITDVDDYQRRVHDNECK